MKKIKTAVIGSGFMGSSHVEALQRIGGVEVTMIVSSDEKAGKELADKFSISEFTSDWRNAVADSETEVIHNCTPNHLHFEINKAAILNGKHILSEKPLTTDAGQSAELISLLKKNPVANAINFNYRFYPLIRQIKSMIKNEELGNIFLIHGNYLQDWLLYETDYNWRLESGLSGKSRAVADIGSHWFDMVQYLTGKRIIRVFADLIRVHSTRYKPAEHSDTFKSSSSQKSDRIPISIDTEDAGMILIEFESGLKGNVVVSQVSPGRKNHFRFEIDGSRRSVAWNQENPNELWMGLRDKPNEVLIKDPALLDPEAGKLASYPGGHPEGYPDGMKNLFHSFYSFIRDGKDPVNDVPDFPTFQDGHIENLVTDAVLKSSQTKEWTIV